MSSRPPAEDLRSSRIRSNLPMNGAVPVDQDRPTGTRSPSPLPPSGATSARAPPDTGTARSLPGISMSGMMPPVEVAASAVLAFHPVPSGPIPACVIRRDRGKRP